MKTIIAGSRSIKDYDTVRKAIYMGMVEQCIKITEVVSGHAEGVDKLGERWAQDVGVPIHIFPAEWTKYGKSAGFKRNGLMVDYAEALIAVYDGVSKGTVHTIKLAERKGIPLFVFDTRF